VILRHLFKMLSHPFQVLRRCSAAAQTNPPTATPLNPDVRHEENDVSWKLILVALGIGTLIGIALLIFLWGLLRIFAMYRSEATLTRGQHETPRTVVENIDLAEVEMVRQSEESRLQSFAPADTGTGRTRISINRAMELVVQEGLPQWPEHHHGGAENNHEQSQEAHPAEHHEHAH
jgi:hypothetical protein